MKIEGRQAYKGGTTKDEASSPPYAIVPILKHIEEYRLKILGISRRQFCILEPALGMMKDWPPHAGLISGLQTLGYSTIGLQGVDFGTVDIDEMNDQAREVTGGYPIAMILTNPPFSRKLKRLFITEFDEYWENKGIPYALLVGGGTIYEIKNGATLAGSSIHIPHGRINYGMPHKNWGTRQTPTKSTFSTVWHTKGIAMPNTVYRDDFYMADHFKALREFNKFANKPYWGHR